MLPLSSASLRLRVRKQVRTIRRLGAAASALEVCLVQKGRAGLACLEGQLFRCYTFVSALQARSQGTPALPQLTTMQHSMLGRTAAPSSAAAAPGSHATLRSGAPLQPLARRAPHGTLLRRCQRTGRLPLAASAAAEAPARPAKPDGHSALLQGLGEVGDVAPTHMPWLLRLAHVKSKVAGGDSNTALQESARGLLLWKVGCRGRGLQLARLQGTGRQRMGLQAMPLWAGNVGAPGALLCAGELQPPVLRIRGGRGAGAGACAHGDRRAPGCA